MQPSLASNCTAFYFLSSGLWPRTQGKTGKRWKSCVRAWSQSVTTATSLCGGEERDSTLAHSQAWTTESARTGCFFLMYIIWMSSLRYSSSCLSKGTSSKSKSSWRSCKFQGHRCYIQESGEPYDNELGWRSPLENGWLVRETWKPSQVWKRSVSLCWNSYLDGNAWADNLIYVHWICFN